MQFSAPRGDVSQLFPIYFERSNAFSNGLVSVRLCELGAVPGSRPGPGPGPGPGPSAADADAISPSDPRLALESSLPHVAIAFDFSTDDASGFASRYEQGCLRIYAPGLDAATFPFVELWPNMENALQMLREEAMREEWRGPAMWGISSLRQDLLWGEERL